MKGVRSMFGWSLTRKIFLLFFLVMAGMSGSVTNAQELALRTNLLSWATTTVNAGAEMRIASKWSAGADIMYKAWHFLPGNRKMDGLLIQPEIRYWFCQPFYQHFMGVHLHYGQYNGGFNRYRYQGDLYGLGITYGYQWILGKNWNLEVSGGVGYARMNYDQYERPKCGLFIGKDSWNYFGITKIGISLVYILKN